MLSKKIRAYKQEHPKAKAKEIATAVGAKVAYVYQVLNYKPSKKKTAPTDGKKIVRNEILRLNDRLSDVLFTNETQKELLDMYSERIEQLEMDVIGYRAVISYLQGQIDGITV
jgi:hypothetical protein